ncbi:MAG: hypothetical protein GW859_03340 [Sphingomonadales bacterium]|nr:hypothetical protein [Sphingomonadales bacterium]
MRYGTRALLAELGAVVGEIWTAPAWRRAAFFLFPYAGLLTGLCIAAHYGELTDAPLPREFFFATDGGFGEWLEYAMTAAVAVLLFIMWRRERIAVYLANAALFVYLTLDNSLQIHERFGYAVGNAFADWLLPVRPNDIGEAALFAAVGLAWLVALAISLRKAQLRPAIYSLILAAGVAGTAFFGVVVDMMVVWGFHTPALLEVETFIEDGGEFAMLCLTFLVAIAIFAIERDRVGQP